MQKDYTGVKLIISIIGGFLLDCIGGWDNQLAFLITLITVDILTGILKAAKQKMLSSTAMREGLCKKAIIVLIIAIAVRGDEIILDYFGHPIMFDNHELYLRTAFIFWFSLEELMSLCENCAVLNVPLPKWLKGVLIQINDSINNSTPTQIIDNIKKLTGKNTGKTEESATEDNNTEDSGNINTLLK